MFQFGRFPPCAYVFSAWCTGIAPCGFPHSDIRGSMPICGSPRLIAACRVLRRLPVPRHSPCALSSLTSNYAGIHLSEAVFINAKSVDRFYINALKRVENSPLAKLSIPSHGPPDGGRPWAFVFNFPQCCHFALFIQFPRCNGR